jgi:HK97 family phage prohead protease
VETDPLTSLENAWRSLEGQTLQRDSYHVAEGLLADTRACEELRAAGVDPAKAERSLVLTINDAGQDRHRSKIIPTGLDLKNYKSNPVVLWAHDSSQPPIARALATYVDDSKAIKRTRSVAEFVPADINPMAETVYRMLKDGWIRGVSIGFRTMKVDPDPEDPQGYVISRAELLEYSVLPIPSNPRALKEARAAGIDTDPILEEAKRVLDGEAVMGWLKANAIEVFNVLEGARASIVVSAPIVAAAPAVAQPSPGQVKAAIADTLRAEVARAMGRKES